MLVPKLDAVVADPLRSHRKPFIYIHGHFGSEKIKRYSKKLLCSHLTSRPTSAALTF